MTTAKKTTSRKKPAATAAKKPAAKNLAAQIPELPHNPFAFEVLELLLK